MIIGVVRNGLDLMGVNSFAQMIVLGMAVFVAVEVDMLRGRLESQIRGIEARRRIQ